MNSITVRVFPNTSSTPLITQEDKKVIAPPLYKLGWKDPRFHTKMNLNDLPTIKDIALIITQDILIVDFDTDIAYSKAMEINNTLHPEYQCKFIVHSSRKGGHFYYTNKGVDQINPAHSDKSVTSLDILSGPGHNAFAPTQGDRSKKIIYPDLGGATTNQPIVLTPIPSALIAYINSIILQEASQKTKKTLLVSKTPHSDNNFYMLEQYVVNSLNPQLFYQFYSIPAVIPPHKSYQTILSLSYRLLKDETLSYTLVQQTLDKYDPEHRQDHRLLAPEVENVYIPERKTFSLTLLHRHTQEAISIYLDINSGDYIVSLKDKPLIVQTETKMKILVESLSGSKRSQLKTTSIEPVTTKSTYTEVGGLNIKTQEFNLAYMNNYLKAFKGTKPTNYTHPQLLIDLTQHMWGDEAEYLLASTQYRYKYFRHTPVVTHIVGTEGSGKDLSVHILTAGFNEETQEVDYTLFMDKHSNHQTLPNTVLEEVGDWNPAERKGALAKIKSLSGSNGKVTVRGMQRTAYTTTTINKIWVVGNSWMKLHNDPITQRRVHAVYMPQTLKKEAGGRYSDEDIQKALDEMLNFYYWLGNVYSPEVPFTSTDYMSAICRQESRSYQYYLDSVEGNGDKIIRLIMKRKYPALVKALKIVNKQPTSLEMKFSKLGPLVITAKSLKAVFVQEVEATFIHRAIDTMCSNFEQNKRLAFSSSPEKFVTFMDAPATLPQVKEKLL